MTTYLGKSCSFCLPRVPFVNCRQFMYLVISLLYQFLIIAYLFTFQSRMEHHRTNIKSQDPLREIPAASAESLPCLHRLQEGLWQGMVRSLMGIYEEIQYQRQHHTSHWKSVWQGPECGPVQWQHRRMVQNYILLERIMCEALYDHEGSVSIGGRHITNFGFADDIVVNADEEEEAGVLVDRLDRTTTRYKMEIGPDKTKVMTNNPNGFQREIKIKGQRLEVENFKYLGAIISIEGSKLEILSRIAQTTAALSRLKIIWRDKNISLASKVKLMRTLILSTFLYACESWTLRAEIERRIQALEMRCIRRLLNISHKDHVTNEEVRNRIQNAVGVHDDLLTMVKKRKLRWYGHISRSSGMAKTILQGTVKGARRRGRQKKRWEDNIKEWSLEIPLGQRKTGKDGKVLLQRHIWYPDDLQG